MGESSGSAAWPLRFSCAAGQPAAVFGIVGDGCRARTMCITILLYSAFTGLTALSTTWWDFTIYRFITGLGWRRDSPPGSP